MVASLDNLRRSGRINLVSAGLGTLLQVKPIVTIEDGEIGVLSRVRTTKRAQQELVNMIREQAPLDRLTLLHANNLDGVNWMREQIGDVAPEVTYEVNVSPVLGTHVGTSALGFVTLNQMWRL
jgi:DegV family protein with EDD domain